MAPFFYDEEIFWILSALTSSVPSMLFGVAAYVLTAYALYTIARRREIRKPWLAWIPVANVWILGSLSDQYQYLVKGQNKTKRKVLLVLNILLVMLTLVVVVLCGVMVAGAFLSGGEPDMLAGIMGPAMAMLGLCVPMLGISIAMAIIRYMALYDIYRSLDPSNSVLFLVLSILVSFTEPFFLFFSRNKDQGMPPRKERVVYTQPESRDPVDYEYQ